MATKPTPAIPTWATNSVYALGDELGNANKIEPPAAQIQDGWRPGERPPAQYENWQRNAAGLWLTWAETAIEDLEAQLGGEPGTGEWSYKDGARARTIHIGPRAGNGESGWTYNLIDRVRCSANSHDIFFDVSDYLPTGAILKRVRAFVQPGAARSSPNRMSLKLFRSAIDLTGTLADPTETQLGVTDEDNGSNGYQLLDVGSFTDEAIDRDLNVIVAVIRAGNTAGTGGQEDDLFRLEVTADYPGPRPE